MPKAQHIERCVLGALARQLPPIEALRKIPFQSLSLYAHAAQSVVWNEVLSRRIRTHGARPVVGDLVLVAGGSLGEGVDDIVYDECDAQDCDAEDAEVDEPVDDEDAPPASVLP